MSQENDWEEIEIELTQEEYDVYKKLADEAGVDNVYIIDSSFLAEGSRDDEEFDAKLKDIEDNFKTNTDEEGNFDTIKLDSACNFWLFKGNTLEESVDKYEKFEDKWNKALLAIFAEAYPEKTE